MAAGQSFQALIEADRKKKKAETLAQSMLGSSRNAGSNAARKSGGPGASLASRVGVMKRTSSVGTSPNVNIRRTSDIHTPSRPASTNPIARRGRPSLPSSLSTSAVADRGDRLLASLQTLATTNGRAPKPSRGQPINGPSMSIRGMATSNTGPFVVLASNFAPGTTAADIEAAMIPVGGEVLQCRLLSARPTVLCEIVFRELEGAENVIATFNNQKADGRLLYVYMKQGGPTPNFANSPQPQPQQTTIRQPTNNTTTNSFTQHRVAGASTSTPTPAPVPVSAIPPAFMQAPAPAVATASPLHSQSHSQPAEDEIMDLDDDIIPLGAEPEQQQQSSFTSSSRRDEGRLERQDDQRIGYPIASLGSQRSEREERESRYQGGRYGGREGGGGGYEVRSGGGGGGRYDYGSAVGGYGDRYRRGGGGYGGGMGNGHGGGRGRGWRGN